MRSTTCESACCIALECCAAERPSLLTGVPPMERRHRPLLRPLPSRMPAETIISVEGEAHDGFYIMLDGLVCFRLRAAAAHASDFVRGVLAGLGEAAHTCT